MSSPEERRRSIRIDVTSPIDVESPNAVLRMTLLNVSGGGFAVVSSAPLPVGVVMRFRFVAVPGPWSVELAAKGAYSRIHHTTPGGQPEYLSGFAFINPESPATLSRIHALMDRATAAVTFS